MEAARGGGADDTATSPTDQDRKAFFEEIVNGEPDLIGLLHEGEHRDVLARIEAAQRTHHPA